MTTTVNHELSPAELSTVATFLRDAGNEPAPELEASLIAGGRSNLTYRIGDGVSTWVMRTPPRVGRTPSAHDVAREYRVTRALYESGFPVARPVALCEDESAIGVPFMVSDFVAGSTIQTREELDRLDDSALASVTEVLVGTLAALHRIDYVSAGLEGFGRPDDYYTRQLRRWSRQWELVGAYEHSSLATEVVRGLSAVVPAQSEVGIVHGDFRIDNTILTPAPDVMVAAVVDWELSTIGDPVADLAMMCAYRHPTFDLIVGTPSAWTSPRLPDATDLACRYVEAGGVALDAWERHLALAYFKVAVIAAGIDHRFRAGAASGVGFDTAGESVEPFLGLALNGLEGEA